MLEREDMMSNQKTDDVRGSVDEIIEKFWKEVLCKGGELDIDFNNPDHRTVYENMCGYNEAELKSDYPQLYKAIYANTRSISENEAAKVDDLRDAFHIGSVSVEKANNRRNLKTDMLSEGDLADAPSVACTYADANYVYEKSFLQINSEFVDMTNPKQTSMAFSVINYDDKTIVDDTLEVGYIKPKEARNVEEYQIRCMHSNWGTGSESSVLKARAVATQESKQSSSSVPPIKSVSVEAPVKGKSKSAFDASIICYNRTTSDQGEADYIYEYVRIQSKTNPDRQVIIIHAPFKGNAVVNPEARLYIKSWDEKVFRMSVSPCDEDVGGEVNYNTSGFDWRTFFKLEDELVVGGVKKGIYKKISWELSQVQQNWQSELEARHVINNTYLNFYAKMKLNLVKEDGSPAGGATLIIQSNDDPQPKAPTNRFIKSIYIMWGCVGKDSDIVMADGSTKRITDIVSGDLIKNSKNKAVKVKAVYSGPEETMIALETAGGKKALLSSTHPVMTLRGMCRAEKLTAADQVMTSDGYEAILSLTCESYSDMVYNLAFEEKEDFYCNGIVVGDFLSQQEPNVADGSKRRRSACHRAVSAQGDLVTQNAMDTAGGINRQEENGDRLKTELLSYACKKGIRCVKNSRIENAGAKPYYACETCLEEERYATLGKIDKKQFAGNTFTLDIWVNIQGASQTILSQKDGFEMGVDYNVLCLRHPDIQTVKCACETGLLHGWNHIFVTYDNEELVFGLNGFVVGSEELENVDLISAEKIEIGRGLDGFVRRLLIYGAAIGEDIIRSRMFLNVYDNTMEGLIAFVDFNTSGMRDISPAGLAVRGNGGCMVSNVIDCYKPSQGGFAMLPEGRHINPGGFASKHFSVYMKFYTEEIYDKKSVLFSNGNFGEKDSLLIYVEKEEDKELSLYLYIEGESHMIYEQMPNYRWIDLAVCYDASCDTVYAYVDGVMSKVVENVTLRRTVPGNVKIGNGFDFTPTQNDYTCYYSFAEVAVFDSALFPSQVQYFYEDQPYLFEEHLVALYSFENNNAAELVSKRPLLGVKGDLWPAADTIKTMRKSKYIYDINIDPQPESENARKFFNMMAVYYEGMFGLSFDTLNHQELQATYGLMESFLQKEKAFADLFAEETGYDQLREAMMEFDTILISALSTVTSANAKGNRIFSHLTDMIGINACLASSGAISNASAYAAQNVGDEKLAVIFDKMLEALK